MHFLPIIAVVSGVVVFERAWVRVALVLVFVLVQHWLHQYELNQAFNDGYDATIAAFGVAGAQIAVLREAQSQAESFQDATQVLR